MEGYQKIPLFHAMQILRFYGILRIGVERQPIKNRHLYNSIKYIKGFLH